MHLVFRSASFTRLVRILSLYLLCVLVRLTVYLDSLFLCFFVTLSIYLVSISLVSLDPVPIHRGLEDRPPPVPAPLAPNGVGFVDVEVLLLLSYPVLHFVALLLCPVVSCCLLVSSPVVLNPAESCAGGAGSSCASCQVLVPVTNKVDKQLLETI